MDAGLFRPVFAAGLFLQLLGVFMTSISTKYWQLFLAQGVCTGIGNGMQFSPTMSLISTYFTTNRSLAIAIAASGTATGGMLFPGLVEALLPRIGFAWTIRVLGFVMLPLGLTSLFMLKTRLPPRKSGPLVEWSAFKELPFMLFVAGMFLVFWSLYFAVYYVCPLPSPYFYSTDITRSPRSVATALASPTRSRLISSSHLTGSA